MKRLSLLTIALGVVACSALETGTIALVYGPDDPFTEPACTDGGDAFCGTAPARVVFSAVTVQGADGGGSEAEVTLATAAYQGGSTVTLPQISTNNADILKATVYDAKDAAIISGQTLPVAVGGIDGLTLDLFVQRRGQFAEMPSPFSAAPAAPPLATIFEGRYILVASPSSDQALLYDLLLWSLVESPDAARTSTTLPCKPLSMAPVEGTTFMLLVCADGASTAPAGACAKGMDTAGDLVAFQFDISGQSCTAQVLAPTGGAWRDVAGGATITAPNGDAFIVGGTRPSSLGLGPSKSVVKVGTAVADVEAGTTHAYASFLAGDLAALRLGAAAVWSDAYGVVVLGGNQSATDDGVEALGSMEGSDGGTSSARGFGFPADPTEGEGAAAIGPAQILVAGGTTAKGKRVSPVRLYDLGACMDAGSMPVCSPKVGAGASDGGADAGAGGAVPLLAAQGFAEPNGAALFVGTQKDGVHAYLASSAALDASELPLRATRKAATAIRTPVPSVVVIGGDVTMESFIPASP